MDGVEGPQPWHRVERAVHPVLGEVGHEHHQWHLRDDRKRPDGPAHPLHTSPREQDERRLQRQDGQHFNQQRVDEEVGQIDEPLAAKHRLFRAERKEPLERDEHGRIEQQIQHEEIHSQPRTTTIVAGNRNARATQQRRQEREADPGQRQRLVGAKYGAHAAEKERSHQRHVDGEPQVR